MSDEPAFPTDYKGQLSGMTLRDYFAGLAMQGDEAAYVEELEHVYEPHLVAMRAYKIADAMLKAREESNA